jgi:hypothetical protein
MKRKTYCIRFVVFTMELFCRKVALSALSRMVTKSPLMLLRE